MSKHLNLLAGVVLMFSPGVAWAEEILRQITVTGQATVESVPDMARLSLGVEVRAPSAAEAMAQNAARMTAIQEVLTGAGIAARDIRTNQLTLNPEYTRPRDNTPRRLVGYVAINQVEVQVRALDQLGSVLGAVTEAGLSTLGSIAFDLQDPAPVRAEARRRAAQDARARAELYTSGLGVGLGEVLSISEGARNMRGQPLARAQVMASEAMVPIAAGEVGVSAQVTVVFALE